MSRRTNNVRFRRINRGENRRAIVAEAFAGWTSRDSEDVKIEGGRQVGRLNTFPEQTSEDARVSISAAIKYVPHGHRASRLSGRAYLFGGRTRATPGSYSPGEYRVPCYIAVLSSTWPAFDATSSRAKESMEGRGTSRE